MIYVGFFFGVFLSFPIPGFGAPPAEFETVELFSSLNEPVEFRFLPDGTHMLISEKSGTIWSVHYAQGTKEEAPFLKLEVTADGERGLLGFEIDPMFSTNGFVYVFYTTAQNKDRLSRFPSFDQGHTADPASEVVLFEATDEAGNIHHGGDMHIGPDGKLWWTMGDNSYRSNAQKITNAHGKILRINTDGTLPNDNAFMGVPDAFGAIWAYGLRNPFRFTFAPNGNIILSDVGGSKWEEVNVIRKGANYGWPNAEGSCEECGYVNPVFAYPHPLDGGAAIIGGDVYTSGAFPPEYQHVFFYADYVQRFIRYLKFDETFETVVSDHEFDSAAGTVVDIHQGPDGNLYYLTIYPGILYKVQLSGGNRAPVVEASADSIAGLAPLEVQFSSEGTYDPDGDAITYHWDFGNEMSSLETHPLYTYTENGIYTVRLSVSDGVKTSEQTLQITVGNRLPEVTILVPGKGEKYNAGDAVSFEGSARDPEDGEVPASAFSWKIVFHHNVHIHPFIDEISGVASGTFQISDDPSNDATTWYRIYATVTDSGGLSSTTFVDVYPNTVALAIRTNIEGLQIVVDGIPYTTELTEEAVVGVARIIEARSPQYLGETEYRFLEWSDGGERLHGITVPNTSVIYTAEFAEPNKLPAPWKNQDIGSPIVAGSVVYEDGIFVIEGAGKDVWSDRDEFHFVYQPLHANGSILARVNSQERTHEWAKAGVMIKESTVANSPYALLAVTPDHGYAFQHNDTKSISGRPYTFPNAWIKLERKENVFNGYTSDDGVDWSLMGTATVSIAQDGLIGLFVTSHKETVLSRAVFTDVGVDNGFPGKIVGKVFHDVNGNGLWDKDSEGVLENWRVMLTYSDGSVRSVVTDKKGFFKFSGIGPGKYILCQEQKEGWIQTFPKTYNACHTIDYKAHWTQAWRNFGNQDI